MKKAIKRRFQERTGMNPVSKHGKWFIPQNIMREVRFNEAITNSRLKREGKVTSNCFLHTAWGCGCCVTETEKNELNERLRK